MSQPQASPASMGQAPQMPAYQAPAPAPQASAPQGNPWQQAFQALSASLNTSPAPPRPRPHPRLTRRRQLPRQLLSPAGVHMAPMAAPISSPQVSTQAYSESRKSASRFNRRLSKAQLRQATQYLSGISNESLEVLEHFGAEAPALLNTYACAVEDALIEQVQRGQSMTLMLQAAGEERTAMNLMLTDPDVLADYVNDFFGPQGPYPTETTEETAMRSER